jgi:hypothetical protein
MVVRTLAFVIFCRALGMVGLGPRPHRGIGLPVPVPAGRLTAVDRSTRPDTSIERVDALGGLIHEYRRAA